MKKELYSAPEYELILLEMGNVVTASGEQKPETGDLETPWDPA